MRALATLFCLTLAACSSGPLSVGVQAEFGGPVGRGAVVGTNQVLTVSHVVGSRKKVFVATSRRGLWVVAEVVQRFHSVPEDLVLLVLETDDGVLGALFGFPGFAPGDAFVTGRGEVATVDTVRGRLDWRSCLLLPGDSGSPVIDDSGNLVGLVAGRRGDVGVYAPVRPQ